ncbi:MAG: hypothetical protein DRR00_06235, partial [Candidatus Parabeggiatoa sp. nov. 3]
KKKGERGQPQGIAPTGAVVGAIPCGCPLRYKYLFICASVLKYRRDAMLRVLSKRLMIDRDASQ